MIKSVVLTIITKDNAMLLIKRRKSGEFKDYLAIPGGKVEPAEHISEAARRELMEEAGVESDFKEYLGCVSEILIENDEVKNNFILHLCELSIHSEDFLQSEEGEVSWYDLSSIENLKNEIIPSDYEMIQRFVINKEKSYFNCVEEKVGEEYFIRKFDK